jgi:radical SAM-linked protein
MRRFRITFSKGEPVRYISHLDLMRTWERILRRAELRLAHSHGFNPRPRLVFAAPLPVAVTSDAEIVDIVIEDDLSAPELLERIRSSLSPGVVLREAVEMSLDAPAVMAGVASSDYVVTLDAAEGVQMAVEGFLASASAPYERTRKGRTKASDMRPAVLGLWLEADGRVGMRLRLDVEGLAVRPEEVVRALHPDWQVLRVHRTALHLKEDAQHAA